MESLICDLMWIVVMFFILVISSIINKKKCERIKLKSEACAYQKIIKSNEEVVKILKGL